VSLLGLPSRHDGDIQLLTELLSIPTSDWYAPLNVSPQRKKEKVFGALLRHLEMLARQRPVLVVYEDVHWIDASSRELLDMIVDRVTTLPVLLIITYRPEFTPRWIGRPHVSLLSLSRLAQRQRAEMIVRVTGGKTLPKEIATQIIERTDGVPLFVEELTKAVVESGMLADAGDHYAVTGPSTPLEIPTTLHASLMARLDRLAPVRELAQIGAAIGREFSYPLLSAVAQQPDDRLTKALDQLIRSELLFSRGEPPEAVYTFKHALVQEAAYASLLRERRRQLHGRIAHWGVSGLFS
jgi:predicted ATPase